MLQLEVTPDHSMKCDQWELILGMHFSQAVAIIQSQVRIIKGVEIIYSKTDPLGVDIVINLPLDGIRLMFDPVVQRLKGIEVFDMKLIKLTYCGIPFNSPEVVPSLVQIEHSFGATHPGVYNEAEKVFALHFRGLSFYFPVDSKLQKSYDNGLASLHFPNGSSPIVANMSLYHGTSTGLGVTPALPLSCYGQQLYVDTVHVLRCESEDGGTMGLRLKMYTEGSLRALEPRQQVVTQEVFFGDSCEDIATRLGAPNRVFYKSEDKMKIHAPSTHDRPVARRSDFFFNYFTLGLDVLFDARTQRCKKLILHTNYTGHYNFNIYHRCEFQLQLRANKASEGESIPGLFTITAFTKWDEIRERLQHCSRPVVLHRGSTSNTANPFGATFSYGYQDIIFEVMPNNHVASMTLYSPTTYPAWRLNANKVSSSATAADTESGDISAGESVADRKKLTQDFQEMAIGRKKNEFNSNRKGGGGGGGSNNNNNNNTNSISPSNSKPLRKSEKVPSGAAKST